MASLIVLPNDFGDSCMRKYIENKNECNTYRHCNEHTHSEHNYISKTSMQLSPKMITLFMRISEDMVKININFLRRIWNVIKKKVKIHDHYSITKRINFRNLYIRIFQKWWIWIINLEKVFLTIKIKFVAAGGDRRMTSDMYHKTQNWHFLESV